MIHLASLGLVSFLLGWAASIDTEVVRARSPKMYISTLLLLCLMLATAVKDIVVQISVWIQFRFNMTTNGLVQHFKAMFLCLPLHLAIIIFALVSFLANA